MTTLLERDVLVISQKAKLIEMTNEYRILDPDGAEVGAIRQEGQSKSKKVFRFVTDLDQFLTHRTLCLRGGRHEAPRDRTAGQGLQVHAEDPRRQRDGPRRDRAGQRPRQEAFLAPRIRGRTAWLDRCGELALMGLRDPRRRRSGGRADHQEVGRHPPRRVHDRRSLRPADHRPDLPGPPLPPRRFGGGPRHRAETGRHRRSGASAASTSATSSPDPAARRVERRTRARCRPDRGSSSPSHRSHP